MILFGHVTTNIIQIQRPIEKFMSRLQSLSWNLLAALENLFSAGQKVHVIQVFWCLHTTPLYSTNSCHECAILFLKAQLTLCLLT